MTMTKYGVEPAYERILQITGLHTQSELAAFLGVKQSSVSSAKDRGNVPARWLITLFEKGINPIWIRTGEGPKYAVGTDIIQNTATEPSNSTGE